METLGQSKILLEPGEGTEDLDPEELEGYGSIDHGKRDDPGTALSKAAAEGYSEIVDILL